MMNMQKKELLNEIEFGGSCNQMDRETIIGIISYLNLVAKLYLNNSINTNMLKTFEGVMIKILCDENVRVLYEKIFYEFKDEIKTAEPPYINLIYTVNLLLNTNRILNRRSFFSNISAWFYVMRKKIYFSTWASSARNWKLAEQVFANIEDQVETS